MYIQRHLEQQILDASKYYPVVMVCGQRQVGKSTMLNHIKEPNRRYVTLDDGNARRLAETDPALFFETYGYPLLIDEFQRVPSILLEMKKLVDQKALNGEDNSGMFWLTGSQKFKMMQNVAESLAGRIAIFDMSSLSAAEIENRPAAMFHPDLNSIRERLRHSIAKDIHQVYEDIFRGGMPKLRATDLDRDRFYMDYVNTYIERDIKDLAQVGKLNEFYDFLGRPYRAGAEVQRHRQRHRHFSTHSKGVGIDFGALRRDLHSASILLQHHQTPRQNAQGILHGYRPCSVPVPLAQCSYP